MNIFRRSSTEGPTPDSRGTANATATAFVVESSPAQHHLNTSWTSASGYDDAADHNGPSRQELYDQIEELNFEVDQSKQHAEVLQSSLKAAVAEMENLRRSQVDKPDNNNDNNNSHHLSTSNQHNSYCDSKTTVTEENSESSTLGSDAALAVDLKRQLRGKDMQMEELYQELQATKLKNQALEIKVQEQEELIDSLDQQLQVQVQSQAQRPLPLPQASSASQSSSPHHDNNPLLPVPSQVHVPMVQAVHDQDNINTNANTNTTSENEEEEEEEDAQVRNRIAQVKASLEKLQFGQSRAQANNVCLEEELETISKKRMKMKQQTAASGVLDQVSAQLKRMGGHNNNHNDGLESCDNSTIASGYGHHQNQHQQHHQIHHQHQIHPNPLQQYRNNHNHNKLHHNNNSGYVTPPPPKTITTTTMKSASQSVASLAASLHEKEQLMMDIASTYGPNDNPTIPVSLYQAEIAEFKQQLALHQKAIEAQDDLGTCIVYVQCVCLCL